MQIVLAKTNLLKKNQLKEMKELRPLKLKLKVGETCFQIQKKWLKN
jgi:hypothetical protein